MIKKLAEELATNDLVSGTNEIRPQEEPAAAEKPSADVTTQHGWPESTHKRTGQDQTGVLSRTLEGFKDESRKYNEALAQHLGDHVKKLTGSVAMSRAAVERNRQSRGG